MDYELFMAGPTVYVPILIISLILTLIMYGAFPLIFAKVRKKPVVKKKYYGLCWGINFVVFFACFVIESFEPTSSGPYILWTWVFSLWGARILKKKGVLEGKSHKPCPVENKDAPLKTGCEASGKAEQEQDIFNMAYTAFLSSDPKDKEFLTQVRGTSELKAAYLSVCKNNQEMYDRGARISWKKNLLGVYAPSP